MEIILLAAALLVSSPEEPTEIDFFCYTETSAVIAAHALEQGEADVLNFLLDEERCAYFTDMLNGHHARGFLSRKYGIEGTPYSLGWVRMSNGAGAYTIYAETF